MIKDMTGMHITNFIVQQRMDYSSRGGTVYRCVCECGHVFERNRAQLVNMQQKGHLCPECLPAGIDNIIGKVYDTVRVLRYDHTDKRGITYWLCKCDVCGKECIYSKEQLRYRKKYVCSCQYKPFKKDLTGLKVGRMMVISYAYTNEHGQTLWDCKCECGNHEICLSNAITSKTITECRECKERKQKALITADLSLIGQTIGMFKVTKYAGQDTHLNHVYELTCQKCGAVKICTYTAIQQKKYGRCTACTLYHKDIQGKRYGLLTALEHVGIKKVAGTNQALWRCICDCGNECFYTAAELTAKQRGASIPSCGCISRLCGCSWWELRLTDAIVQKLGPNYKCRYQKAELRNKKDQQFSIPYIRSDGRQCKYFYDLEIISPSGSKYIIECNGTKWHPKTRDQKDKYGEEWTNVRGIKGSIVYDKDRDKQLLAEQLGYVVKYLWDDVSDKENIQIALEWVQQEELRRRGIEV